MPVQSVVPTQVDQPTLGVAEGDRVAQDGIEDRAQVERRLPQRPQDAAKGSLLCDEPLDRFRIARSHDRFLMADPPSVESDWTPMVASPPSGPAQASLQRGSMRTKLPDSRVS